MTRSVALAAILLTAACSAQSTPTSQPAPAIAGASATVTPTQVAASGAPAAAACPAPRAPTFLPWGRLTPPTFTSGPVSSLRSEAAGAFFVLERRADTIGAPTSVTDAPYQTMGREMYRLWSGTSGASEVGAWWDEGTGPCHIYHARLSMNGDSKAQFDKNAVMALFDKIIASIPAAFVDPSAGKTGLLAEIPLEHVPSSVAVIPFENRLFVADRDGGLSAFDTATNALLNRVVLPLTGPVPPKITAIPSTKRVYVTDFSGDRVLVIDGAALTLVGTVPTGRAPTAITADAKANRIYVANLGLQSARFDQSVSGSVTVIDGGGSVLATVPTRGHPITLDVSPSIDSNRLYVGALGLPGESSFIQVIDTFTKTEVASVGVSAPSALVADPVDNAVYAFTPFALGSKLTELDTRTNVAATYVDPLGDARAIGWHPGSDDRYRRIYVASHTDLGGVLHIYRTLPGSIRLHEVGMVRVGTEPVGVAVDGATHRVYVASAGAKTVSVVLQGP